ncbi:MAG: hypothetical protein RL684_3314 [Pseudomonadota bacterium]|jgi:hypothetical protein
MRDDQYVKFKHLADRLVDVVVDELNPDGWSGAGMTLSEMDKDTRGDRYWSKKNASQTLSILMKMHSLTRMVEQMHMPANEGGAIEDTDAQLDKQIRSAEKQAEEIMRRVQARANEQPR